MVDEFAEYTGGFYIYIKDGELTMTAERTEGGEPVWSHSGSQFRKQLAILNIYQYVLSNNNLLFYYSQVEKIDDVYDLTFNNLEQQTVEFFKTSQNIYNLVQYLLNPENITREGLVFNTHGHIWEQLYEDQIGYKSSNLDEMIGLSIILNIMVLSGQRYKEYEGEYAIYIPNVNKSSIGISVIEQMKDPGENRILLPIEVDYTQGRQIFYNTDYMDVFDMENITSISNIVADRYNQSDGNIIYNNMQQFIAYKGKDSYKESKNGLRLVRLSSEKFDKDKKEYNTQAIQFTKEQDMGERVSRQVQSQQYFNEIDTKKTLAEQLAQSTGYAVSAQTVGIMAASGLKSFPFFASLSAGASFAFMIGLPIIAVISTFAISSQIKYFSQKRDQRYEIDQNKLIDLHFFRMSPYNGISVQGPSLLIGLEDFIESGENIYDLKSGETDFNQSKEYLSKFYVFDEDNKAKPVVIMDDYGLIFGVEDDDTDSNGYGNISIFGALYLTKQYNKETNNFVYNLQKAQLSSPIDIGRFSQMPKSIVRETYEKAVANENQIRQLINAELFMLSSIQNIEYVVAEENVQDAYEQYRHQVIQNVRYLRYKADSNQIAIGEGMPILIIPIHSQQNVSQIDTQATSLQSSLDNKNLLMTFSQDVIDRCIYQMSSVNMMDDVRVIIQTVENIVEEDVYIYKKYGDRDYRLIGIQSGRY